MVANRSENTPVSKDLRLEDTRLAKVSQSYPKVSSRSLKKGIVTSTSELQTREYDDGIVELTKGSTSIFLKPGLLSEREAMILADSFLRFLGGSAPVLDTIREVHVAPVVESFAGKYRSYIETRIVEKRKDDPRIDKIQKEIESLHQKFQGLSAQTKSISARMSGSLPAVPPPIKSGDDLNSHFSEA